MLLQLYALTIVLLDICILLIRILTTWVEAVFRTLVPPGQKSISGDTVLITGAGHGIGRELAYQLSRLGATLICSDINLATAEETATFIKQEGGRAFAYQCDVSQRTQVESMAERVHTDVGPVSIVINNAGIMPCHPFLSHSVQEIDRCIDVNLKGCLWVMRSFLPDMVAARKGHIVSMASIAGAFGCENLVPYSASKFAVRGLMEAMVEEIRRDPRKLDIKCTTVCPFVVDTGLCKKPRVRFPRFMRITDVSEAAAIIIRAMRREASIVFVPEYIYYIWLATRWFPERVTQLWNDFLDTGVEPHDD